MKNSKFQHISIRNWFLKNWANRKNFSWPVENVTFFIEYFLKKTRLPGKLGRTWVFKIDISTLFQKVLKDLTLEAKVSLNDHFWLSKKLESCLDSSLVIKSKNISPFLMPPYGQRHCQTIALPHDSATNGSLSWLWRHTAHFLVSKIKFSFPELFDKILAKLS